MNKHETIQTYPTKANVSAGTRVVHEIRIDLSDTLANLGLKPTDQVEVTFVTQHGDSGVKRLSYTDIMRLTEGRR
jgi:hypothetical protein